MQASLNTPTVADALGVIADAYPGEDGKNAFISSAWQIKFKQAFITHPPQAVAAGAPGNAEAASAASRE